MDQSPIVVFLHLKGLSTKAKDVHNEIVQVLESDAIGYSNVAKYIRNNLILQNEPEAENRGEDQSFSIPNNAILEALEMMSYASIRQIVKMTFIPPTTVFRRLTKSFDFFLKRLHWVHRKLSNHQKQARSSCERSC
jgi:hypothetical protein